ncbi:hypothetical protein DIPPA_06324, partial [Diplonema papillatum]
QEERRRDLEGQLERLLAHKASVCKEIAQLHQELVSLQRQSSVATAGAYATVVANKAKYMSHMQHVDSLLQGVIKTLAQFPALRRFYLRVKVTGDLLQKCYNSFAMWCSVFDRLWGPEATINQYHDNPTEVRNAAEAGEDLISAHSEVLAQLEEFAQLGDALASGENISLTDGDDADGGKGEANGSKEGAGLTWQGAAAAAPASPPAGDASFTEQNLHAVNILRVVEVKLQGLDNAPLASRTSKSSSAPSNPPPAPPAAPDLPPAAAAAGASASSSPSPSQPQRAESLPLTVQQQVSRIIAEATDTNNLVHMYEGWTAWI